MELISTKICKTSDIGVNDNLFGGRMLSWLDESGAIMACDKTETKNIVTLKIEEVLFKLPVKVNDHIRIYGEVNKIGKSSIVINLEARRKKLENNVSYFRDNDDKLNVVNEKIKKEVIVCSTNVIFVQVDENGKSLKFSDEQLKNLKND